MRFMHIADVHLGARPDKGSKWSEQRADEIWKSFQRIIYETNRQDVDLLLIAGDLFHSQPLVRDLKEVDYLFQKLERAQVVLIMGNHDYIKRESPVLNFHWNENVTMLSGRELESVRFEEYDTTIYGLSYYEREIREPLYDTAKPDNQRGCHILLAHGGDESHIPIDKRKLEQSGFDYIAMGHIHKPEMLLEDRCAYAGALEPIDQNDTGKHGYILGEYHRGKMKIQFQPFASREYIHLEIKSDADMTDLAMQEKIRKSIGDMGADNIFKIILTGVRDADITYYTEKYGILGNIVAVQDKTEPDYDLEELYRYHKDDVIGRYMDKLGQSGDMKSEIRKQALYVGIRALLGKD